MRRFLQLCVLAAISMMLTPEPSEAGLFRRSHSRSTAVSRTKTFSLGGSGGGCANGQCARPAAASATAVAGPAIKAPMPMPKQKAP